MIVLNVKHTHTRKNVPNKRLSLIDKYTDKNKTCVCARVDKWYATHGKRRLFF